MSRTFFYGLVLAGGQSRRMQRDKCLLEYGGQPQWRRAAALLASYCAEVYISGKPAQHEWFGDHPFIPDNTEKWGDIGPMNGLLEAFATAPGPWVVVGCDYPLLQPEDLLFLMRRRNADAPATVFCNSETGFPEPLIGVYEPEAASLLRAWHASGNESLRHFLQEHQANLVPALAPARLQSVDTPEAYDFLKNKI